MNQVGINNCGCNQHETNYARIDLLEHRLSSRHSGFNLRLCSILAERLSCHFHAALAFIFLLVVNWPEIIANGSRTSSNLLALGHRLDVYEEIADRLREGRELR